MLRLITLPFRWVRAARYALIAVGAALSGLGLWMQINGIPPAGEPVVSGLGDLMALVIDGPTTVFGVFSKIGGVMAMLGLFGMTVHDIAPARAVASDEAADQQQQTADPVTASTWQDRLAAKTVPQPAERVVKSTGTALRIGVIGVVICAFLAVLGATLLGGPVGQAPTIAAASTPGQAMIRAHLATDGVVSDASPAAASALAAFAIPNFDPTTIVPWVKVRLAAALAGDQAAMITLGSIFGGIFVLLLGIKIMFALRRDRAAQRTPTRRVSYS